MAAPHCLSLLTLLFPFLVTSCGCARGHLSSVSEWETEGLAPFVLHELGFPPDHSPRALPGLLSPPVSSALPCVPSKLWGGVRETLA